MKPLEQVRLAEREMRWEMEVGSRGMGGGEGEQGGGPGMD